jgi:hypothetical protein
LLIVSTIATRVLPVDAVTAELVKSQKAMIVQTHSTPSAPVFVSMVWTSFANFWMLLSELDTVLNPISSPHPPTADVC